MSAKKGKIVIVTGVPLTGNPRVVKEANALHSAGYEVVVLGAGDECLQNAGNKNHAVTSRFLFQSVGSMHGGTSHYFLSLWQRVRSRLGRELFRVAGIENRFQLGYFVPELLRAAIEAAGDYYILHTEQSLWVGAELLRKGYRVGLDFEDWYSEDLLPEARRLRPLRMLRRLEQLLLRRASHSSCPSSSMSQSLGAEYGAPLPKVIYNAFLWSDRLALDGQIKDRKLLNRPSIHWVSQTIGPGRGLEDLFGAIPYLTKDVEIHLRGTLVNGGREWLEAIIPNEWSSRIFVHALVSETELLSRISEHDIGFAGEMKYCRSRDLTVTNKILHYLLGGLAVVASDTAGQREVATHCPDGVFLFPSGSPEKLAACLNSLLEVPSKLLMAKSAALESAKTFFCWEQIAPRFIEDVGRATADSQV
ncbi:MAG: glycosyl transferase family 1 [Chthoniobacteraceae bacterium]|nr:glycosyl transferase family 1 [Chthoniobacteraceae bacterium]